MFKHCELGDTRILAQVLFNDLIDLFFFYNRERLFSVLFEKDGAIA